MWHKQNNILYYNAPSIAYFVFFCFIYIFAWKINLQYNELNKNNILWLETGKMNKGLIEFDEFCNVVKLWELERIDNLIY